MRSNSEETNADVHSDLLRINDALIEENERGQKSSSVDISQTTLIWRAVKLPLYTVALIPLMVECCSFSCNLLRSSFLPFYNLR